MPENDVSECAQFCLASFVALKRSADKSAVEIDRQCSIGRKTEEDKRSTVHGFLV